MKIIDRGDIPVPSYETAGLENPVNSDVTRIVITALCMKMGR